MVSTVSFSLVLSWYRFRLEFIDVILLRCVLYVTLMLAVLLGYSFFSADDGKPPPVQMLLIFLYSGLVIWCISIVSRGFKRLWAPGTRSLNLIHQQLPQQLANCTTTEQANTTTERFVADLFQAPVAINRSLEPSVSSITLASTPPLEVRLGYIKGWRPWISDALNWVHTAALYLQGHLQVLDALEASYQQTLQTRALSELAAKAELSAMYEDTDS